jgi:ketosteroid isomerase-like protein
MDPAQSEVSALLDSQADAMRTKDLDRLMSLYSPDVAYFDTVPPLQYAGSAALRERFSRWFDGWEGSFEMEIRDIHVLASGDLAVAYRFSRARGTLKNGQKAESWVRATRAAGCGGAVQDGAVELQGDLRDRARDILVRRGFTVKG